MIKYIDPTKFEFRKETIELSRVIEKARLLRNSEFRVSEGVQGELKMRMVKELLTEKIASDIYQIEIPYKVELPVSLWQYWKSRYAPQWFLDRFPVVVFEQALVNLSHLLTKSILAQCESSISLSTKNKCRQREGVISLAG